MAMSHVQRAFITCTNQQHFYHTHHTEGYDNANFENQMDESRPNYPQIDAEEAGFTQVLPEIDWIMDGQPIKGLRFSEREYQPRTVCHSENLSITGDGVPKADCGRHLRTWHNGTKFIHTTWSCHRQSCPICSRKWQYQAGVRSAQFIRSIAQHFQKHHQKSLLLRHIEFNRAKNVHLNVLGKLQCDVTPEGHPAPNGLPSEGEETIYGIEAIWQAMLSTHDDRFGLLGAAFILHPYRETFRGSGIWIYSPHLHLITNWMWKKGTDMKSLQLTLQGTITTHLAELPDKTYSKFIPTHPINGVDVLQRKFTYNFSHAQLIQKIATNGTRVATTHPVVRYRGLFYPGQYITKRSIHRELVVDAQGHAFYEVKTRDNAQEGTEHVVWVDHHPVPVRTKKGKLRWLTTKTLVVKVLRLAPGHRKPPLETYHRNKRPPDPIQERTSAEWREKNQCPTLPPIDWQVYSSKFQEGPTIFEVKQ